VTAYLGTVTVRLRRLLFLIVVLIVVGIAIRCLRGAIPPYESRLLTTFPGAVTFGGYMSLLLLASALLVQHIRIRGLSSLVTRHCLLFGIVIVASANLILVNYKEILVECRQSWYGLVILLDVATWLVCTLSLLDNQPHKGRDFSESAATLIVPAMFAYREVEYVSMPLSEKATFDLIALALVACLWAWTDTREPLGRERWVGGFLVVTGLLYGLLSAVWSVASELLGLGPALKSLEHSPLLLKWISVLLSMVFVAAVLWWVRGLKDQLGSPCAPVREGTTSA